MIPEQVFDCQALSSTERVHATERSCHARPVGQGGSTDTGTRSFAGDAIVTIGFILELAVGILILVSGLIMPIWAVIALGVVWLVGLVIAIRWRRKPAVVLAVPLAMIAIWAATAWAGDALLDWTA